jgi:RNA polymerase sigma factor (sigma-70 family)
MPVRLPPFQALLDDYREDVHRFLVASVGPVDADDCFQETFISALRAYPRLRDASNLRGWLLTIAHRKAIDAHRSRQRRAVPVDPVPEPAQGRGQDGAPAVEGEPELWKAVRELPPKQRAAIVHRYVNDLPYAEIAVIVGCSEEAARQNVRAGLGNLRGAWAR